MKLKYIIFVFIVGIILITIGALFKVLHLMLAVELLTAGTILQIIALILFIIKLFTNKKFKDTLNQ
ncbi:gliding motility protein GldL [Tenacibaculum sp. AHE15PA]|uniref:gliding motility protein GldL n=1 Tax=unclassified Tenacibaculum TaxID=2635139 RepID=UPI001C4F894F|nr:MULTISPECIES: gliding motility protein GldL [unclassified Tenacibaculum]QXP72800.1 gliding motility protein GldL [Tenacibaculum sp. AHE14PA]QXP76714.1 gliding motility protein GldL [Tenacibaculum sp. AHE15PA]